MRPADAIGVRSGSRSRSLLLIVLAMCVPACTLPELRTAQELAGQGEWDAAVDVYQRAAARRPFDDDVRSRLDTAKRRAADVHYLRGEAALEQGRVARGVHELELAFGLDPSRHRHRVALDGAMRLKEARDRLRIAERLKSLGRADEAMIAYERAATLDPGLTAAYRGITALAGARSYADAVPTSTIPVTLRFRKARLTAVLEILARSSGLNLIVDKDVPDDPVTIFLNDMPFNEALRLILRTSNLTAHAIDETTLLISSQDARKLADFQDLMIRTFYLSNTEAENATDLVRSILGSRQVFADKGANAVVVRETPEKLHLAERVIHSIDRQQPEVVLEVEVLEVDRNKRMEYGFKFAKRIGFGVVPPGADGGDQPATFTYEQLTGLGSSSFLFKFPSSVSLDFFKSLSDARTLASPKIRVVNRQQATINVGDQQPILLSTTRVTPGQASSGATPTTSTVTSTEFRDTGVRLTVEPTVHLLDELSLKVKIDVTRVGEQVILQESPEIKQFKFGNRTAETTLRVADGETVVLAGLIADEQRRSRETVPWLGDVPILRHLLTGTETHKTATEIVVTLTPRIVRRMEIPPIEHQAFWSGTGTRFSTSRTLAPSIPGDGEKRP